MPYKLPAVAVAQTGDEIADPDEPDDGDGGVVEVEVVNVARTIRNMWVWRANATSWLRC